MGRVTIAVGTCLKDAQAEDELRPLLLKQGFPNGSARKGWMRVAAMVSS